MKVHHLGVSLMVRIGARLEELGIAGGTFADAILDRLVHNAHRLTLDGPSMRKTEA